MATVSLTADCYGAGYFVYDNPTITIRAVQPFSGAAIGANVWGVMGSKPQQIAAHVTSAAASGASVIQIDTEVPIASYIYLGVQASNAEAHMVTAVSGSGPYTLTLVGTLASNWAAGTPVVMTIPVAYGTTTSLNATSIVVATSGVWASGGPVEVDHYQFYTDTTAGAVAGGGCGVWQLATGSTLAGAIWWAVAESTTTQALSISWDSSASTIALVEEFSGSSAGDWSLVAATSASVSTASTSPYTLTFPSLTATANGQVYSGHCQDGSAASSGGTTGFSYLTANNYPDVAFIYNPDLSAGAVAPVVDYAASGTGSAYGAIFSPGTGNTGVAAGNTAIQTMTGGAYSMSFNYTPHAVGNLVVLHIAWGSSAVGFPSPTSQGCTFSVCPGSPWGGPSKMFNPSTAVSGGYTNSTMPLYAFSAWMGVAQERMYYCDNNPNAPSGMSPSTAATIKATYALDPCFNDSTTNDTYAATWLDPVRPRTPWISTMYANDNTIAWATTVQSMVGEGLTGWAYEGPVNEPEYAAPTALGVPQIAARAGTKTTPMATVSSASNGGNIADIASWTTPGAGILSCTPITYFNVAEGGAGYAWVSTSAAGGAVISYTGTTAGELTGCALVSGSGTVSTGGAVDASLAYTVNQMDPTAKVMAFCSAGIPENTSYANFESILSGIDYDILSMHDENSIDNLPDVWALRQKASKISSIINFPYTNMFRSETGISGSYNGVYHPRGHAAHFTAFLMVHELYLGPKEQVYTFNTWLGNSGYPNSGFLELPAGIPSSMATTTGSGGSLRMAAHCARIFSESVTGCSHLDMKQLPFGASGSVSDYLFLGTHYTSDAGDVVCIKTNGIGWTANETVTLFSSSLETLRVWNGVGQDITDQCTVNGNYVTVPVDDLITYVFLPSGVTVSVYDTGSRLLSAFNSATNILAAPGTVSLVGSVFSASGGSVSFTAENVGDIVLVAVTCPYNANDTLDSVTCSAVSGGFTSLATNNALNTIYGNLLYGIITSTGATSIDVTFSGTPAPVLTGMELTNTLGPGMWVIGPTGTAGTTTGEPTAISLTPLEAGDVYVGVGVGPAMVSGATSGFTYAGPAAAQLAYNLGTGTAALAPTWTTTSGDSWITLGAIIRPVAPITDVSGTVVKGLSLGNSAAGFYAVGVGEPYIGGYNVVPDPITATWPANQSANAFIVKSNFPWNVGDYNPSTFTSFTITAGGAVVCNYYNPTAITLPIPTSPPSGSTFCQNTTWWDHSFVFIGELPQSNATTYVLSGIPSYSGEADVIGKAAAIAADSGWTLPQYVWVADWLLVNLPIQTYNVGTRPNQLGR